MSRSKKPERPVLSEGERVSIEWADGVYATGTVSRRRTRGRSDAYDIILDDGIGETEGEQITIGQEGSSLWGTCGVRRLGTCRH